METKTLSVPNISCGHCVSAIESELSDLEGIRKGAADAQTKTVTVEWEAPASLADIRDALKEINYPAAD